MKWDVDQALDSLSGEAEALERSRAEILVERAKGARTIGFLIAGGFVGLSLIHI